MEGECGSPFDPGVAGTEGGKAVREGVSVILIRGFDG
jgi:hypothetical protein